MTHTQARLYICKTSLLPNHVHIGTTPNPQTTTGPEASSKEEAVHSSWSVLCHARPSRDKSSSNTEDIQPKSPESWLGVLRATSRSSKLAWLHCQVSSPTCFQAIEHLITIVKPNCGEPSGLDLSLHLHQHGRWRAMKPEVCTLIPWSCHNSLHTKRIKRKMDRYLLDWEERSRQEAAEGESSGRCTFKPSRQIYPQ